MALPTLIYDQDNPFWRPRYTIHGNGTRAYPYELASSPTVSCPSSPNNSPIWRKLKSKLKLGSQEGSIN